MDPVREPLRPYGTPVSVEKTKASWDWTMDDTKAEKAFQESMLLGEERGDTRVLAAVQWTVELLCC